MIVTMHQSRSSMVHTLDYNNNKVVKGVAQIIHINGIRDRRIGTIKETFKYRERSSVRKLKTVSFHLSVNPSKADNMNSEQVIAFVQDIMKQMGYKDQPWVIYQHDDIDRRHYHVVSIRINEKGRKIKDYYEKKKCLDIVEALQEKYGFIRGKEKSEKNTQTQINNCNTKISKTPKNGELTQNYQNKDVVLQLDMLQKNNGITDLIKMVQITDDKKTKTSRKLKQKKEVEYHLNLPWVQNEKKKIFVKGQGNITETINAAIDNSLNYHFTTEGQFALLMESHCIRTTLTMDEDEQIRFEFRGVDQEGSGCTRILNEKSLGQDAYQSVTRKIKENIEKRNDKIYKKNRYYLKNIITQSILENLSINDFLSDMVVKGIDIKFFINKKSTVSGVTIIDHNKRTVYKCSEIDRELTKKLKKLYDKEQQCKSDEKKLSLSQALTNAIRNNINDTKSTIKQKINN